MTVCVFARDDGNEQLVSGCAYTVGVTCDEWQLRKSATCQRLCERIHLVRVTDGPKEDEDLSLIHI